MRGAESTILNMSCGSDQQFIYQRIPQEVYIDEGKKNEAVRYSIPATHVYQQGRNIVIPNYSTPSTTQYTSLECVPQEIMENKPLYNGSRVTIKSYHKHIHHFCNDNKLDNDQITKLLELISHALPRDHHLAQTSQKLFELIQDKIRCPNCCCEINTGGIIHDPSTRQPFTAVQNNSLSISTTAQNDEILQTQMTYLQEPYTDAIQQNKKFKSSVTFEPVGHSMINIEQSNNNDHHMEDVAHLDPSASLTTSDAFKIGIENNYAVTELYNVIRLQNEKLERNLRYTQHLPGQMNNAVTSVNNFLRLTSKLTSVNKIEDDDPNVELIINNIDLKDAQVTNSYTGTGRNCIRHVYGADASGHLLKHGEFEILIEAIAYLHKIPFADVWSKAATIKESLLQMKYDNKKQSTASSATSTSNKSKIRRLKQATTSTGDNLVVNSVQELITTALPIAQSIEQQSS
ncbi:unnamed protein product [Didymodactylos carnosus]|uniref:Uncharacterized protein n=1 Tax=Didymodactylos carnosus TaxID=1234261 RepID=A0A8S2IF62_9BILA|nr:unnamed protein product [Didymodactylos carnosus]CAF3744674.1 unnamed protein product [Didymodactylos carnosus]